MFLIGMLALVIALYDVATTFLGVYWILVPSAINSAPVGANFHVEAAILAFVFAGGIFVTIVGVTQKWNSIMPGIRPLFIVLFLISAVVDFLTSFYGSSLFIYGAGNIGLDGIKIIVLAFCSLIALGCTMFFPWLFE